MEKVPYQRLRWEIITAIIGFSVVPLLLLGAFIYQEFSLSYTAKIQESLKTLAENRRASLDLFLDERVSQLVTLAGTNSLERLRDEDYLHKVFNIIQTRSRHYIDLGVIDEEGNHLAYVGPYYNILKGVNYKNEEWFSAVMASGVYISDVFTGFRRIPHFIIAVMVRERNKIWILRATIDSEIVENIVRAALIGKHGDAFLVNRDNILQTNPRFHGKLLEPVSCALYGEACPNFSGATSTLVEEKSIGGLERLYGVSVLQNKRWVLVIIEDPLEQLSPLFRARHLGALIGLAGILVIVVGAVFITRAMMKELERMERKKATADEISIQSGKMAALGKMAAGIAHEINNPLAVIGEKAGWMKDLLKTEDLQGSENFQEFADAVNKIESHINRAKTVTHRLLGFARRMEPVSEKVSINRVLDETIDFLENEARYRNIDVQTDYDQELPAITSDSTQLQQVFLNILNNAIDAIGKDGEILIRTSFIAKNNALAIEISDNGPGIPKDALNKIFDPFFTTKEVGKGTGLGLSISYSIVEKLGGRMMVASHEGMGTTFTIYLPVDIERPQAIY
ncbi:MAG: GHKL domain-containing protein [Deltaproteobacteria bacterium]|nr:GHKL domain-containing protein [Deltaproteobacteria bacterium]